ncbi:MAG: phosphoglycerate dehydrogenase [Phycisphaeraceae bacterium]|nr:phosphoglycerate dehydrogenase [Phycisphaeraceae bacterium]
MRILLTTTSYQDTPGRHHDLLAKSGHEIVRARGPLPEKEMLRLVSADGGFDGFLHGDDEITRAVLQAALPRLKAISKYGIGLDSVDVKAATELKVPVLFTPGVNHTTVAEHTFGLIIMLAKHLRSHTNVVKKGEWKRTTGIELAGKTLGIIGLGRIGKEVAKRARAFDMQVIAYDVYWDEPFAFQHGIFRAQSADDVVKQADIISLHMNLTPENREYINAARIDTMKKGSIIVNCARGGLVNEADIAAACKAGKLYGYGTDVLEHEPIKVPHPFQDIDNIIVTPHIASRTFESVERQALMSTENLLRVLKGEKPLAQANSL